MSETKIPYQSKEWVEKVMEMTNADSPFRKSAKAMNDINVYIISNCPDGTDRITMCKFEKGAITEVDWESRPTPFSDFQQIGFIKQAAFITMAPYDFMCRINKKEIGPLKALSSKEMKVQGSKAKMMRLIKPLQMWQDILHRVPTQY